MLQKFLDRCIVEEGDPEDENYKVNLPCLNYEKKTLDNFRNEDGKENYNATKR